MFTAYVWSTVNSKGEIGMYFVSNITFITIESPLNNLAVKSGDFFKMSALLRYFTYSKTHPF